MYNLLGYELYQSIMTLKIDLALICVVAFSYSVATTGSASPAAPSRVLEFPADVSMGRLTILPDGFAVTNRHLTGRPFCEARGRVVVPAGAQLMLNAADVLCDRAAALDKLPADALVALTLERASLSDAEVVHLGHLTGLRWLDLHETDISDRGLKELANLTELNYLDISHTTVRGEGFAELKRLKKLLYLDIGFNNLVPIAFAQLAGDNFPVLRILKSSANNVTDDAVNFLGKLASVSNIELTDQKNLTDKSLPIFKSMKNLKNLDLRRTRITLRGLAALKGKPLYRITLTVASPKLDDEKFVEKALPGVQINLDKKRDEDYSLYAPTHF